MERKPSVLFLYAGNPCQALGHYRRVLDEIRAAVETLQGYPVKPNDNGARNEGGSQE